MMTGFGCFSTGYGLPAYPAPALARPPKGRNGTSQESPTRLQFCNGGLLGGSGGPENLLHMSAVCTGLNTGSKGKDSWLPQHRFWSESIEQKKPQNRKPKPRTDHAAGAGKMQVMLLGTMHSASPMYLVSLLVEPRRLHLLLETTLLCEIMSLTETAGRSRLALSKPIGDSKIQAVNDVNSEALPFLEVSAACCCSSFPMAHGKNVASKKPPS